MQDSVRLTFTDWVFTYRRGSDTVRGIIDVVDPTPAVTDHAIRLVFTEFARIHVNRDGLLSSTTLNGSRQVIRDADHIAQTTVGFHTAFGFSDGSTASHVRDWDNLFTADSPGSIRADAWLPSGVLTNFTTPAPLHFNAACEDRPRFDCGTLVVVATRNGATSTIPITFTACGEYTLTRT